MLRFVCDMLYMLLKALYFYHIDWFMGTYKAMCVNVFLLFFCFIFSV